MTKSLAVKYRPQTFEDVAGQTIVTTILKKVIEKRTIKNAILLCGASGCGKTTLARIIAHMLNGGECEIREVDGASNNGVDNVRALVAEAKTRSVQGEYKIIIIDECHAITTQGWQAFLKGIEEPAPYTIFIFCTTEPNKIPQTILNRVQRYNIASISSEDIKKRLEYICQQEHFTNYTDSCDFIAKMAKGCMRDAITMLDQCADYSTDITLENVKVILGDLSYETMIRLTNKIIDKDEKAVLGILDSLTKSGQDLKQFINNYLDFILDLNKYILFKDLSVTSIPKYLETVQDEEINVRGAVNFSGSINVYKNILNKLLELKQAIKFDLSYKLTITVYLLQICRGI